MAKLTYEGLQIAADYLENGLFNGMIQEDIADERDNNQPDVEQALEAVAFMIDIMRLTAERLAH